MIPFLPKLARNVGASPTTAGLIGEDYPCMYIVLVSLPLLPYLQMAALITSQRVYYQKLLLCKLANLQVVLLA